MILTMFCSYCYSLIGSVFFFQAEDGIRDFHVTGVQTCALPIWRQAGGGEDSCVAMRAIAGPAAVRAFKGAMPGVKRGVTHQSVRFCETSDGVRIAYATSGHGRPLVRVATWLTTLELEWGCAVCRPWLSELSLEHTLVRFDPRGSGLSQRKVERLSLEGWVADVESVVDG